MNDMPADRTRDTRTLAVEAFSVRLADQGYLGVSLDAVASDVGVRKASLYHHFPDGKEALYREAALAYVDRERRRVAAALGSADHLEGRLVALALLDAEPTAAGPELGQQVFDATRHVSDDTRATVSGAYCGGLIDPVIALMGDAVAVGEIAGDPEFLAWSFLHLAQGITPMPDDVAMPPDQRGPAPDLPAQARAVVRLFLDGARTR
jgi:AcrR family transcriptional regulator